MLKKSLKRFADLKKANSKQKIPHDNPQMVKHETGSHYVYYLRHGEREDYANQEAFITADYYTNTANGPKGSPPASKDTEDKVNPSLTLEGFKQATQTAFFISHCISDLVVDKDQKNLLKIVVVCSPYLRCFQTASRIHQALNLLNPPKESDKEQEPSFGRVLEIDPQIYLDFDLKEIQMERNLYKDPQDLTKTNQDWLIKNPNYSLKFDPESKEQSQGDSAKPNDHNFSSKFSFLAEPEANHLEDNFKGQERVRRHILSVKHKYVDRFQNSDNKEKKGSRKDLVVIAITHAFILKELGWIYGHWEASRDLIDYCSIFRIKIKNRGIAVSVEPGEDKKQLGSLGDSGAQESDEDIPGIMDLPNFSGHTNNKQYRKLFTGMSHKLPRL